MLLLTFTQQQVPLFDVDRWSATEIEVPDLPAGVDDTLPDHDRQVPLQLHRAPAGSADAASFHGHRGAIDGNPDPTPIEQLREATWQIAGSWFAGRRRAALERYEGLAGTGLTALLHTLRNGGTAYLLPADATGDHTYGAAILRY